MGKQIKQHYVARMYLRGFLDPIQEAKGQKVLWLYEAGRHPSLKSIRDVGCNDLFYEIPAGSGNASVAEQPGFLETKLQQLEARVAPTLRRLADGEFKLTAQQRGEFAGFVALSMCRTPFFANTVDRLTIWMDRVAMKCALTTPGRLEALMEEADFSPEQRLKVSADTLREFAERVVSGKIKGRQTNRGWTMKMVFIAMRAFMDQFEAMRWGLVRAADDEYFITSDNPVVVVPSPAKSRRSSNELQFAVGTQFYFPIARSYLLTGLAEKGRDWSGRATKPMMDEMRQAQIVQAQKEVYSPYRDDAFRRQIDEIHARRIVGGS